MPARSTCRYVRLITLNVPHVPRPSFIAPVLNGHSVSSGYCGVGSGSECRNTSAEIWTSSAVSYVKNSFLEKKFWKEGWYASLILKSFCFSHETLTKSYTVLRVQFVFIYVTSSSCFTWNSELPAIQIKQKINCSINIIRYPCQCFKPFYGVLYERISMAGYLGRCNRPKKSLIQPTNWLSSQYSAGQGQKITSFALQVNRT